MITKKKLYLIFAIIFPIVAFYIVLWLYNIWFDTLDKIKYDPTYSPEFDQNKTTENFIYWIVIILSFVIEFFLIRKYKSFKATH
jgi:hypothetical protein